MIRMQAASIRRGRRLLPLCAALSAVLAAGAASGSDWPHWRGPARSGVTPEQVLLTSWPASGPRRLWSAGTGKSYASVSVQGERLFAIGTREGRETVTCFDARTGAVRWRSTWDHPKREGPNDPNPTASTGTPVVAGERVYVLTREGDALCLSAKDGKRLWQRDLAREIGGTLPYFGSSSSPVVEGDLVLYNIGKHGVALDRVNGTVVWNSGPGTPGHASPVLYRYGGRECAAFFTGDGLVGVELRSGRRLWRHASTSPNHIYALDPIVSGDRIFITGYGRAQQLRLSEESVSPVYEARSLRSTFINPVLVDGHLYGSDRGGLQCLDWATGTEKWTQPNLLRGGGEGAPAEGRHAMSEGALIAAGKHLLILDDGGTLHMAAASPEGYREVARAKVLDGPCWTAPVLANGRLYCRNNSGELVCLDLRPGSR